MKNKEILAIIPARGGSKGIPGKNMIELCGKPLIQFTIDAAKSSKILSKIILSSDDDKIINYCQNRGIDVPFKRPGEYSDDNAPMIDVVQHAINFLKENENYQPDYVALLQPTSPLRKAEHISEALEKLINSGADSVVSVVEVPHNYVPDSLMRVEDDKLYTVKDIDEKENLRQNKPKLFARNGPAVLVFTYDCILNKKSMYGDSIVPYLMEKSESVDIDSEEDIRMAEYFLKI